MPASMYAAYGGRFSWTVTALSLALRLLARLMPVSSARPDSGDSSYATRMLLNIFDSLLRLRDRLQYRPRLLAPTVNLFVLEPSTLLCIAGNVRSPHPRPHALLRTEPPPHPLESLLLGPKQAEVRRPRAASLVPQGAPLESDQ